MELILVIVLATNGLFLLVSFYLFVSFVIKKIRRSKQINIVLTTLNDEFDSNCEEMYESKCERVLQVNKPKIIDKNVIPFAEKPIFRKIGLTLGILSNIMLSMIHNHNSY